MKQTNRIVFIHWAFPYGGAEMVTLDVANYLVSKGWIIDVISPEFINSNFPSDKTINFNKVIMPKLQSAEDRDKWIIDYINHNNVSYLVCKDECLIKIRNIKEHTDVKVIFHLHGLPLWEVRQHINEALRTKRKPLKFLTCKLNLSLRRKSYLNKIRRTVLNDYISILNTVDSFVVLCNGYKLLLNSLTDSAFGDKIVPIYNSSDPDSDTSYEKEKIVMYMGRLSYPDKRVDRLLRIWKYCQSNLKDWKLLIVGDGPDRAYFQKLAYKLKLTNISFEGWAKQPYQYYRKASIVCLTSEVEGWGLALAEAQCHGAIPMAFDVSEGVREIISPTGVNGILIEAFDEKRFAHELIALAKDKERLTTMSYNVRKHSELYNIRNTGQQWIKMLESL